MAFPSICSYYTPYGAFSSSQESYSVANCSLEANCYLLRTFEYHFRRAKIHGNSVRQIIEYPAMGVDFQN